MINHDGGKSATGKSTRFSSATRALLLGLALLLPGAAAQATAGTPIQGIPIGLEGDPEGARVSTKTDERGAFNFTKLPAGKYKVILDGQLVQTISIDANRSISGVLSSDGGKASITFNGQVGVVPDGPPGAPVNTSRSNKKAGKVAENNSPPPADRGLIVGGANIGIPDYGTRGLKIADNESPRPTTRRIGVAVGDVNEDGVSETRIATASKAGDVYGQPVTFTASKAASRPEGGEAAPTIFDRWGNRANPGELPGLTGTPISDTPIGLEGDPGSIKVSTTTGPDGAYQFTGLPAGKYKVTLPGLPAKSITIGADGKTGGKVVRGSDGNISIQIFLNTDITTKTTTVGVDAGNSKATGNPAPGFGVFPGVGSVMSGILPGMDPSAVGPGAGPMRPGGPVGASPTGPGAGAVRR